MGMTLALIVLGLLTLVLVKLGPRLLALWKIHRAAARVHNLPKHWLWGTLNMMREMGVHKLSEHMVKECAKRRSKIVVFWRGPIWPSFFLTHYKTVTEILKTTEPKNTAFKGGYSLIKPWLGDGLLVTHGKKWERNRKLLTPAFHFQVLRPYIAVYNDAVDVLLCKFEKASGTEESVEIYGPMTLLTLDIMLRCAFSYHGDVQEKGEAHPYVRAVTKLSTLVANRVLNPLLYIDFIYYLTAEGKEFKRLCDFVHEYAEDIIERRKRDLIHSPDVTKKRHLDFLDILLEARDETGNGLTKSEMRVEVDTFLFAGHDTTASLASWALYALCKYPDVQEKVFREVRGVLGSDRRVEWDDLSKLEYTGQFLKEVLRMYVPITAVGRRLTKPLQVDGMEIPPGATVLVSLYTLHNNPEIWGDPEVFRPERFAEEKFATRDPYSFVPFSAGPRNCIGQVFAMNEEKVLLSRVVNRFRLELDENHPVIINRQVVTRTFHGIKVKVTPRG